MHTLLLLGSMLLSQAPIAFEIQPLPPESTLVSRPVPIPAYRLSPADLHQQGPFEYSDAYAVRLEIHKLASFATLPLFVLQYISGQQKIDQRGSELTNGGRDGEGEGGTGLAQWHGALAGSIAGLFAINTITGGWNLLEARKDPENRTWRTIHGVLMLVADAGFVVTGMTASDDEGSASTHRAVAMTSMGVALVSYAMMLPPFRRD